MNTEQLTKLIESEGDFEEFEHSGYKCIIKRNNLGCWCGYVGIPPLHPLYGYNTDDIIIVPKEILSRNMNMNRISPLKFFGFCSTKKADNIPNNELPIHIVLEAHGGLNFSDNSIYVGKKKRIEIGADGYTVDPELLYGPGDNIWFYGFDCGHAGDLVPGLSAGIAGRYGLNAGYGISDNGTYKDKDFVTNEVKFLADQLLKFKFSKNE